MITEDGKHSSRTGLLLFFVFTGLLGVFKFSFHELWKDEWQAWLVATDPASLGEMFSLLPFEGHPPLWFVLQRVTYNLVELIASNVPEEHIIQVLHFLLTAATFFIFFTRLRLHTWMKIGLALGYFLFFEYGVINRGYILVMLFSFLAATWLENPNRNFVKYSLCIALLCLSEIYGVFIALSLTVYGVLSMREKGVPIYNIRILTIVFAWVSGVAGFVLTIYSSAQAQTYSFHQLAEFDADYLLKAFQGIFVNSFWLGTVDTAIKGVSFSGMILSIILLAGIVHLFYQKRIVLFSYMAFLVPMFLFTALIYLGGPRHWGMHVVLFITLLSILSAALDMPKFSKVGTALIASVILFQAVHNFRIVVREKKELFSNSITAGRYIKKNVPLEAPVFGINKFFCTPVSGYANRPFFSFPYGKPFTYFEWREKMFIPDVKDIISMKVRMSVKQLYVLSYKPLDANKYPGLKLVKAFDEPSIRQENYFLYRY